MTKNDIAQAREWLESRAVDEVECLIPDITGIGRGKILPMRKFLRGLEEDALRIPESIFQQCVTGATPLESSVIDESGMDVQIVPDVKTLRIVPWYEDSVAQVICDVVYASGKAVDLAPREVLKRILLQYDKRNWQPVIAPELEFYLVAINNDADYPLKPPKGHHGRDVTDRQAFGIEAANYFDPVTEQIYDYCEKSALDIDTLAHEAGAAQLEINFNHGDPLSLADQVFLFKRTVRQAALKHGIYATFMAKPHQNQPGSSMHVHQSVLDRATGDNLFVTATGRNSRYLRHFLGGLERYVPAGMAIFAPNVNSYRRIARYSDAPINVRWGIDNRTVGFRIPRAKPSGRRVENRIAGADTNPYLAIATSLACGLLGIRERLTPQKPVSGDAYRLAMTLPRHQQDALSRFAHSKPLRVLLGENFAKAYIEVKNFEHESYQQVISSWERENLLLNV